MIEIFVTFTKFVYTFLIQFLLVSSDYALAEKGFQPRRRHIQTTLFILLHSVPRQIYVRLIQGRSLLLWITGGAKHILNANVNIYSV